MYRNYKNENIFFVFLLIICFYFIIYRNTTVIMSIRKTLYNFLYPSFYLTTNYKLKKSDLINIQTIAILRKENNQYKIRNKHLVDQLRNYNIIYQDYKDLITLLNLKQKYNTTSIFAKICFRDYNEWYQSIIINKGIIHGLYNGLPVFVFNKQQNELCVMGKIKETYKTSSKVILITKLLHLLPVTIKNKGIHCLAEGTNSNLLKITYIPKDANIKCGDKIVVSPLSTIFQQDILVGFIIKILHNTYNDNFKTAIAKVVFDNNVLCKAVILLPSNQEKKK
jgi:rod shape-determining protein MreC